jgi:heme exporter protein CcmD
MDLTAPHLGFVLAAYGLSLLVLTGLVLWLSHRNRTLARALEQLEAQGSPRRRAVADVP